MNSPPSFEGDPPGDDEDLPYEWIDEWLCEYVDGTMDPSLEAVFEQYVEANPELKAHVQRLRQTRELLCGCDVPEDPEVMDPTPEVTSEVEEDLLQSSPALSESVHQRPTIALGIVSSIAVALVVGFLAGSMFVAPTALSPSSPVSAVDSRGPSQQTVREEAPPRPGRTPMTRQAQGSSFSVNESLVPRPASTPLPGPDTVGTSSTLGDR